MDLRGDFSFPALLCTSHYCVCLWDQGRTGRETKQWDSLHALGIITPLVRDKFLLPQSCKCLPTHCWLLPPTARYCLQAGAGENRKNKNKNLNGVHPHTHTLLRSERQGFSCLSVWTWWTLLGFEQLPLRPGWAILKEKNCELPTSLADLWILVSFTNSPATICFSASLASYTMHPESIYDCSQHDR